MKKSKIEAELSNIIDRLQEAQELLKNSAGEAHDQMNFAEEDLSLLVQNSWPIENG